MGLLPGPPSGRQREEAWEGGKRKLSGLGVEDASKGIRSHFQAAQLYLSEERAGERVAGSRTLVTFVYTVPIPPAPGLPGARMGAAPPGVRKERKARRVGWVPGPPKANLDIWWRPSS